MKAPEDTTRGEVSNSSANGATPSQNRRPRKLRPPPKLGKRTTPSDGQSEGGQQRQNGTSERSNSNEDLEIPNGVTYEQREGSLNIPNQGQPPEKRKTSPRPRTHHQRTTVRRESAQSAEPDQTQVVEREQRSNSPGGQVRETRVQQMLSPKVNGQEVVPAQGQHPGQSEGVLSNGTNANTGQVIETTEAVTDSKSNDQLKLRLDLNLDIEIELKAKIRGDLTLQLLQ
ncbi:uncharacterized protein N7443_007834 [Penicillium atrosanguineum]|uniref:Uncharacterized protein n=1 Tax=Penicillium atrosanguineum TaxID=1132637 RepID=A0A9W9TZB6_9EURO|nr:uncharacterized protein N7443_007834 [Penicillium atrosanguineum]KAJ5118904.1 hypothetical protein N7526_010541 [Penicillium atrosanguineum]KAJ5296941.1 hypothetical protein N7443_007834 [Penicillium atrosanguineum]KAJ5299702.1 hypothetical protein N7476_011259 [Penicillium atrosanguineum]